MKKKKLRNGVDIIYLKKYKKEAKVIEAKIDIISNFIKKLWGVKKPEKYRIFILKSSFLFILLTGSWYRKILVILFFSVWLLKDKKMWNNLESAYTIINPHPSILLKPMIVYDNHNDNFKFAYQNKLYNTEKLISNYCHEAVHVFSRQLKLPLWLNEGLAIYTSEKLLRTQIIKNKTFKLLKRNIREIKYKDLYTANDMTLIYNHIKGYWTVRYLEENYPGFLKDTFRKKDLDIEKEIAKKTGISIEKNKFWHELDDLLYNYFQNK